MSTAGWDKGPPYLAFGGKILPEVLMPQGLWQWSKWVTIQNQPLCAGTYSVWLSAVAEVGKRWCRYRRVACDEYDRMTALIRMVQTRRVTNVYNPDWIPLGFSPLTALDEAADFCRQKSQGVVYSWGKQMQ